MKFFFIAIFTFLFGCTKKYPEQPTLLSVTNLELVSVAPYTGKGKSNLIIKSENNTQQCTLTTMFIEENDTIESFKLSRLDNKLYIDILSSPCKCIYSCWDNNNFDKLDSCFYIHDVLFDTKELEKGKYDVSIVVNGINAPEISIDVQ